jgi:hypothetical protein
MGLGVDSVILLDKLLYLFYNFGVKNFLNLNFIKI